MSVDICTGAAAETLSSSSARLHASSARSQAKVLTQRWQLPQQQRGASGPLKPALHTPFSPEADFIISILSRFSFRISASLPTGVRYLDDLDKGGAPRRIRSGKVKSGRSTKDVARTENIDTTPPRRHAIRTPAFPRLKARRKTKSRLAD